jgi:hypothetical protein
LFEKKNIDSEKLSLAFKFVSIVWPSIPTNKESSLILKVINDTAANRESAKAFFVLDQGRSTPKAENMKVESRIDLVKINLAVLCESKVPMKNIDAIRAI